MQKSVRLSPYIHPEKYTLTIKPDFETFTFSGEETIDIYIEKPTKTLILHALELTVASAAFSMNGRKPLEATITFDKKQETVIFTFPKTFPKGKGILKVEFSGILNDNMIGFYKSQYTVDGKTHHIATTQLESTHARRAFPCFDEPAKKAVFEVTLHIPQDMTVISNTIETDIREHKAGYKIVSFAPTPKMSTYLLAFIVGQFEHIEKKTPEGILVRVFVTPGKKKQAEFALDVAAKTLSFFHNYFDIPYPLPVMDLIAIPDFAAGAMENWGAVTYRETALLVDEEHSSTANKQWVALVIAHELAHQWFGNLVTMEWWTHLWLNEGFASFIEYLAVDHIFPDWHIWTQFVAMDHTQALELDSLKHTHPIEVPVGHPDEINEIFDAVSYSKGASIIRMLAAYLGERDFQKGLSKYLKKHAYGNAKTEDLWMAFEHVSHKPVRKIMKDWTGKGGYPLVTLAEKNSPRTSGEVSNTLTVSQARFFQSPKSQKESNDKSIWSVPFAIQYAPNKISNPMLMTKKTMTVPHESSDGWLKVNPKEVGFFRVAYPKTYLAKLQKPIVDNTLATEDRFGIIRDVFALAKAGKNNTTDALLLASAYRGEEEYIVWSEITSQLGSLANVLFHQPYYTKLEVYNRLLLQVIVKQVGWDKKLGESHSQTLLRSIVLYHFGSYGDKKTITKAQSLFADYVKNKKSIVSDLRSVVYSLVAKNGGAKEYHEFMQLYEKEPLQEEKDRILRAMCLFKDKKLLQKSLDFSFSKHVRAQDAFRAVAVVWANNYGRELAWKFVQEKWDTILDRFGKSHLLPRFIQPMSVCTTAKDAKEIESFFKKKKAPGAERTIAQVLEEIYMHDAWFRRDHKAIEEFLEKSSY